MSGCFNGKQDARQLLPVITLILFLSLAACGQDMHRRAPEPSTTTIEERGQAHIAIRIAGTSSQEHPTVNMPGFHVNAATLHLRVEAADIPEYDLHLPVTTYNHVVAVPPGSDRTFHLGVENHWGLPIYQSRPKMADLATGERLELSFRLKPIETILPLAAAAAAAGRDTVLTVEAEDSPLQDLRLIIPGEAISQPLWVSIDEVYNSTRIPAPERQASVIVDIQPHHVRLNASVTLTLPYYQALSSRLQMPENHLRISSFNVSEYKWQPLAQQVLDADANTATAQLNQFGLFVLTAGERPLTQVVETRNEPVAVTAALTAPQDQGDTEDETAAWSNESITMTLQPHRHGTIGIILRYQDAQSHYRFVWELFRHQAYFVKYYRGHRTVLASVSLPYMAPRAYLLHIVTESDTITVSVADKLIFSIRDSDIPLGTVALNCTTDASLCFDQVRIE